MHEHDELVLPEHDRTESRLGRLKREHTEVEAALRDFGADLSRRNAAHVDVDQRVGLTELGRDRQHHVDRCLVGADEHAPAPEIAQVLDRALGFLREAQQTLGVVAQESSGVGQ
jgi:hypothetical protein